jgi:pimeloyl-ACP methyl ester carboxylesterase
MQPYAEVEGSLTKTARNAIALTVQSVVREDWTKMLEAVDVPLLAVYGDKDPVISHEACMDVVDGTVHARSILLPGAHHFPMLEQTARFTRLLRDFMDLRRPAGLEELTIKDEWRRRTR